mgnify:CR=1 FL=1
MKKRMFHKGMAAVLAVSLTTGGALPFMAQTVHAEDTAAEQGQTPEKKSGTVTLEKKNDGTYVSERISEKNVQFERRQSIVNKRDYKLSYRNSDCVHTAGGQ